MRPSMLFVAATLCIALGTQQTAAQKHYGPGASDTEIKIGNIVPYSGPASAYGAVGKMGAAYIKMLNENGGINGRRINFVSYDDAYNPPKTVEQARRLVENDEVLFLYQTVGVPPNVSIMKYMNQKRVPQLMIASGGTIFGSDPKTFPWTMPFNSTYQSEGRIYAKWILSERPDAKIAVLYANDDYGKDVYKGLKDGLGERGSMIVSEASYDITDPTIDSQIVKLKSSGANVFINITTPKFAAMAIRKIGELGWKPTHLLSGVASSVGAVIKPAGYDHSQGIISSSYMKDPTDAHWKDDPAMVGYRAFLQKYLPDADPDNVLNSYTYGTFQLLEHILREAGDNLTRENVMKVAESLHGYAPSTLLPGISMNTGPNDHLPIKQLQLMRFEGTQWVHFGSILEADIK